MAVGTFDFFSDCLRRNTTFRIILPNEEDVREGSAKEPMKTLILLHGYCGGCNEWLWYGNAVDMAQKYHLCIVLPTGENSFYLDGKETERPQLILAENCFSMSGRLSGFPKDARIPLSGASPWGVLVLSIRRCSLRILLRLQSVCPRR